MIFRRYPWATHKNAWVFVGYPRVPIPDLYAPQLRPKDPGFAMATSMSMWSSVSWLTKPVRWMVVTRWYL